MATITLKVTKLERAVLDALYRKEPPLLLFPPKDGGKVNGVLTRLEKKGLVKRQLAALGGRVLTSLGSRVLASLVSEERAKRKTEAADRKAAGVYGDGKAKNDD
jgi:hypothetical protein